MFQPAQYVGTLDVACVMSKRRKHKRTGHLVLRKKVGELHVRNGGSPVEFAEFTGRE